jgi:hypothetical protein
MAMAAMAMAMAMGWRRWDGDGMAMGNSTQASLFDQRFIRRIIE